MVVRAFTELLVLELPLGREISMARVLIIDDDDSVCIAIKAVLLRHDCVAVVADRGQLGLQLFSESHFDVVMIDIFMPGMDGLETIKGFRKRAPSVPIIAMSGFVSHSSAAPIPDFLGMAAKLGASYCLQKPYTSHQLIKAINASLGVAPEDLVA
jgi:two-component system, response regulator, stage 0 sporulation protein F